MHARYADETAQAVVRLIDKGQPRKVALLKAELLDHGCGLSLTCDLAAAAVRARREDAPAVSHLALFECAHAHSWSPIYLSSYVAERLHFHHSSRHFARMELVQACTIEQAQAVRACTHTGRVMRAEAQLLSNLPVTPQLATAAAQDGQGRCGRPHPARAGALQPSALIPYIRHAFNSSSSKMLLRYDHAAHASQHTLQTANWTAACTA
jgi:hypothetical protein